MARNAFCRLEHYRISTVRISPGCSIPRQALFDTHIRTVISATNAIESVNARIRRAVNARGHFPNEQAALKCVYLAVMSLDPTGKGRQRWSNRWKAALNAFDITFDGRLSAGQK
jgi:transposase-like protein